MADLTAVEARVLSAVDEASAVSRLRDLVAVPSVSGTAAECDVQHLVGDWLEELDCAVDRWPIDLAAAATAPDAPGQEVERTEAWGVVGTAPAAEDGLPALVLSGHTDVVPPGDRALWPADPFDPRVEGGAVHGRGACDMKAGVVAALAALAAVRAAEVRLARPVAVHAVVGEEDGGLGAWATLRRGHRGEVCVIPEPTAGAVVTANAGALTFRLEVTGHAAHAAHRDRGVSAVVLFERVHAGLRDFEAERQQDADPRFGGAPHPYGINIGRVQAGDWASSVPDRLVADGRYGVRLGEDVATARAALEARLADVCAADPWLAEHPVRLTWTGGAFASGSLPHGHPLLPAVQRAVADTGAGVPPERAIPAGSDLRLYAAAGVPTLHYGPGDLHLAHGPLERVPVDELVTAARALALLTLRACGVA
ncbi:ArgE/DapE family deacylase [Geodermatophilus obscurus]|uniref:Acetylornithine deacetylase or succinyl-diaminopimelate desuccinylase n=1 Tax=Geodermatophilus obscurus (strain ATCC 25078 / DSM 43160 / JCM 3152 / CCUG 61914 / KCC A-0152 / KCTC 9177 / NBRC 13315 / NRRL B-3577 / G-20) TaxID=526225 RepID=D2S8D4_GEOOG|nr:ArgE/DapE family deacylase [Geodermatophilus obscurus]ADB73556.1 acetylornithine deacetylase or succinyl- diaminopimelate desuccinylase [Geodermatophilus obscurus DSM 43160]